MQMVFSVRIIFFHEPRESITLRCRFRPAGIKQQSTERYSNLSEVDLFANGKSLGKKTAEDHFFYFDVPLAGETVLTAKAGVCTDESLIRKVSRPNPEYVLRQPGAVLNWCDVSQKEGFFCLNDRFWNLTTPPPEVSFGWENCWYRW